MADSFSVKAILSAKDSGFSSTLKSALGSVNSLGDRIKSGFAFGALTGMGQQAFSMISSSVKNLFGEAMETSDAMYKLQAAMRFSGTSEAEIERIAGSTGTLKTYADKTVFSLQDVMSTFGALSANGIKDADKLTESVGNAVAVFGGGANEYSSVALAFSQSMAAGKMNAQDWNQVLNASPQLAGGLKKELQKLSPVLAKDFKGGLEKGAITAELLGKAMNNIGMTEAAKEAATSVTTWEGAMGNLEATVSSGLMTLYDSFAKSGLISVVNSFSDKLGGVFDWLGATLPKIISKIKPYWTAFKDAFSDVGSAISEAFSAVYGSVSEINGEFGSTKSVSSFKDLMISVANGIKTVANFIKENSDTIAKLIKLLPKVAAGFLAFKTAKTAVTFITPFAKGIGSIASKIGGGLASKLSNTAKATEEVGKSSGTSSANILKSAQAFALMAVGVLLIAVGFAILAQSAIALANSGGAAIAVMAGLVVALVGLGVGMAFLLKTLAPMGSQLMPVATAMLAMGAAVLMVSIGFAILAVASIALANAGGAAIGVMVGMVAAIALLAVGAAVLGASLTAGAVGFIAFGAAVLMVGAGFALIGVAALLAANALTIIATVLPTLAASGLQGALAITALGASLLVFAVGAGVAGAACLILGAGLIVAGAGVAVLAVGILVAAVAILAAAGALAVLNLALPLTIQYGALAGAAMIALGAGFLVLGAGALVAAVGIIAFGAAALVASAGVIVFGGGMIVASAGSLILAGSLKMVNSSMKSIAKNAKATQKSLKSMNSSVDAVGSGLDAIGNKAKSAMTKLTSAFDNTASDVKSSGQKVGDGFTNGMKTGLAKTPATAQAIIMAVNVRLLMGKALAYQSGSYIAVGFAQGMLSQLAIIQAAANRMVAAADKAIQAKAKIHSPSKLSRGEGRFFGEGWVVGVLDMVKEAKQAVEELVYVPQISTPKLAHSYAGELSEDYSYSSNGEYIIEVPVAVDGREFARATATYTQSELNRKEKRENRKKGKV